MPNKLFRLPNVAEKDKIAAHDAVHLPADAQWLADTLLGKAKAGDRRARRLLKQLVPSLRRAGAVVPEPTWPPIWHPSRRKEIGL